MPTWIGLFRSINVGGKNILPMAELRSELESLGFTRVRTYIQSGNVVFDSDAGSPSSIVQKIRNRIESQHGFRPHLIILRRVDLANAMKENPFPEAVSDPKTLHFFFLAQPAENPDTAALENAKAPTERFRLMDRIFYLHTPDGIGRSKLAAGLEKHLGIAITARNYRTIGKLLELSDQEPRW